MLQDHYWVADVYIREDLDREALFALRANRQMVAKADSNGDLFVRLVSLLEEKSLDERKELMKPRTLKQFLWRAFGFQSTHVGRELQALRSETLLPLFIAFCRTRYGADHFKLTWASQIALDGLDFVSPVPCGILKQN